MTGFAAALVLCALIGGVWDYLAPSTRVPPGGVIPLLLSGTITGLFGYVTYRYGKRYTTGRTVTRREALLSVSSIWVAAGIFGGLPFILGAGLQPADSFFESVSGLTTTGATIITDIEARLSRPLLLWRSVLQWLGGMGIVVLFVAVFPNVGSGAKKMFKGEVPGAQAEGLTPRIAETGFTLWKAYLLFTIVEFVLLSVLGMEVFEALCHALTTMSTGGFSTRDASVAAFQNPAFEYVIAIFMLIGSVNYGLYYAALRTQNPTHIFRSTEFRVFVVLVAGSVAALTFLNLPRHGHLEVSFRNALFVTATTISSTGYGTDDYTLFGSIAFSVLLFLMFVGGCSGSTAGGIKIERVVLMAQQSWAQIRRSFQPNVVQIVRLGRHVIAGSVLRDVTAFFVIYMGTFAIGVLLISAIEGQSVQASFGAILTCLSNMGPAPFHEGADNFAAYSSASKLFFVLVMLLGRLEFFTLLALLVPDFWRR